MSAEASSTVIADSLRSYFRAAAAILSRSPNVPLVSRPHWLPGNSPNTFFESHDPPTPDASWGAGIEEEQLHALPEFAACSAVIAADPRIAPVLNKLVGGLLTVRKLTPEEIIDAALRHALHRSATADPDTVAAEASRLAEEVIEELSSSPATITTLVPFPGLEAPTVRLNERVELSQLTDDEIRRLAPLGLLRSLDLNIIQLPSRCCLRIKTPVSRIVANKDEYDTRVKTEERALGSGAAWGELFVNALRIHKAGGIRVGGYATFADFVIAGGSTSAAQAAAETPSRVEYTLTPDEAQQVKGIMAALLDKTVAKHRFIDVAIRRLRFAGERSRIEDRFLDLMIGAEALFLVGSKDSEISYRFSLRVANLVQMEGMSRRQLFLRMREAYKLRSGIVHGNAIESREVELVNLVEETLRRGIRAVLQRARQNPNAKSDALVDWDGLILGD